MPPELVGDLHEHAAALRQAALALPIAAALGAALAFRPRRSRRTRW
jgi:hypothetical protein